MSTEIDALWRSIADDLSQRFPSQRKTQREKLAILVATMLDVRSGCVMKLAHGLPIDTTDRLMRFQWIKRFLSNRLVDVDEVMSYYSRDILRYSAQSGEQAVLILDQSTISSFVRHEMLMVALRVGKRAIPICWRIYEANGSLGWREQQDVLEQARRLLPEDMKPMLYGDRFYGHGDLITWCDQHGWDYCLRLKGSLVVSKADGSLEDAKLIQCYQDGIHSIEGALLTRNYVKTNIQMLSDPKHQEPWIIATSQAPDQKHAQNYAKRWGIEAMFSDFKTRGFELNESQLRKTDRINRIVMIMAIALYWAVSTGMHVIKDKTKKNRKSIIDQLYLSSLKG